MPLRSMTFFFASMLPTISYDRTMQRDPVPKYNIKARNCNATRQAAVHRMFDQHRMRNDRYVTQLKSNKTSAFHTLPGDLERRCRKKIREFHITQPTAFTKSRPCLNIARTTRQDVSSQDLQSCLKEIGGILEDILQNQTESWRDVTKEVFLQGGLVDSVEVRIRDMFNKSHKIRVKELEKFKVRKVCSTDRIATHYFYS